MVADVPKDDNRRTEQKTNGKGAGKGGPERERKVFSGEVTWESKHWWSLGDFEWTRI